MLHKLKSVVISIMLLSFTLPTIVHADVFGLPATSDGGLLVGSPTDPYWFQISGDLKVDQRVYWGDTEKTTYSSNKTPVGQYVSGAFIRALGLTFDGGVGKDWTYTIALGFQPQAFQTRIDDAFITYKGFNCLMPNFTVSIGQVVPGFCISCAASGKWIPFLERSMGTNTFGPQQGLGISGNTYDNNYSLTVALTQQPKTGQPVLDPYGNIIRRPDLWQVAARSTFAPIAENGKTAQFGFSAHFQEYGNTGLQFATPPEMRSGSSFTLLNTSTILPNNPSTNPLIMISALNQTTIDLEFLGILGPWSTELEYQSVWVHRGKVTTANNVDRIQGPNLRFSGYHAQVAYILTGETRPRKKSNGTLGQIKPTHCYGAYEAAVRYSFITLNDKDVSGGMAHNTSASISWYANNNLKFMGEYVYSLQSRAFPTYFDKRHLSSIGLRMQVVF